MAENGIAKPEDFRQAAEARRVETQASELVVLPRSGFEVLLRRPNLMWFLFHGRLPVSLAARHSAAGEGSPLIQTAEEFVEFSKWVVELLTEVFVAPRLSMSPAEGEISPDWLAEEDLNFIIRWAVGEVASLPSGSSRPSGGRGDRGEGVGDLAQFCRKPPGPGSPPWTGGGTVPLPPEPVAQGDGDGLSN